MGSGTEHVQGRLPPVLREVALQGRGPVAGAPQLLPQALGPLLRAGKDQNRFRVGMAQQLEEKRGFQVRLDGNIMRMSIRLWRGGLSSSYFRNISSILARTVG